MRKAARFNRTTLFLLVLLIRTLSIQGFSRNLLQNEENVVVVQSEAELQNALSTIAPNGTVQLEMETVVLTRSLVIDVPGVTLEGIADDRPTLRCPSDNESALIIRNGSVTLRFLKMRDCTRASAVIIETMPGKRKEFQNITFEDIRFQSNGESVDLTKGGAVVVRQCSTRCLRPSLTFDDCTFIDNRAGMGGAIYAEDADIQIRRSLFRGNQANLTGGAIYMKNTLKADLEIRSTRFLNNRATFNPDVHGFDSIALLSAANKTLAAAGLGGAIYSTHIFRFVIERSTFVKNIGCRGGGAMTVRTAMLPHSENLTYTFSITNSHFEENVGFCGPQRDALKLFVDNRNPNYGGVLLYETVDEFSIDWLIQNSTFLRNRARVGGSISLEGFTFTANLHQIIGCIFDENIGLVSGASLFAMNAIVTMMSSISRNGRAVYGGAIILWSNAHMYVRPDPDRPEEPTIFEGCTALYGGAIHADSTGFIDMTGVIIRNNSAFRNGGGVRLGNIESGTVIFSGATFENNTALVGGGISGSAIINITITSLDGSPMYYVNKTKSGAPQQTLQPMGGLPTVFRNNVAAVGGGMYYEPGHDLYLVIRVQNAHFVGNRAVSMRAQEMRRLKKEGRMYEVYPPAKVEMPNLDDQLDGFSLLTFLTHIDEGHGGAICITLINIRLFTIAEVLMSNILAQHNEAIVGGGMSVHTSELYWNRNNGSCFPAAYGLDTCQTFVFQNVTMTGNKAKYAGGVFATKADGITLKCNATDPGITTTDLHTLDFSAPREELLLPYCAYIYGNTLTEEGLSGPDAGTTAFSLVVQNWMGPLKQVASGAPLVIPCEDDADVNCSRPLTIVIKDIFNQTIVTGIDDANLEISLTSDAIIGDLRYTAVNGVAKIDNTRTWGINKTSKLKIVAQSNIPIETEVEFSTRGCYPGETIQVDVCRICPLDQYSFDPASGKCESCEVDAICTGGAVLVPADTQWHSTPFSPVFRCCIHPEACTFDDRVSKLSSFYDDGPRLQRELRSLEAFIAGDGPIPKYDRSYQQCAEGYEGILCGSCMDNYGHTSDGACEKCPEKGSISGLLVFLSLGWLFLLIGINCGITLMSMNARVHLVKHELHKQRKDCRPQKIIRSTALSRHVRSSTKTFRQQSLISGRESDMVDIKAQYNLAHQLVATVQLTETLKILMNYLQVNSVALHLQTNWNTLLNGLLTAEAGLVGFSTEVVSVPFECNFSNADVPASIKALWMRLAMPAIVMTGLILTFVIVWSILSAHHKRQLKSTGMEEAAPKYARSRLVTCIIVISIVAAYFSFINIVRGLLRGIHCIKIEETAVPVDYSHPYIQYAIESSEERVWAEDTQLMCFKGEHQLLGVVCVVGLFMAFCFIIAIAVWLPLNKKYITRTEFVSRYWFIYQAYRKKWYTSAWESTILLRKAMIVAILVYSVHLGPSLQASLCAGILIVAHILHSVVSPFKIPEDHEYVPEYAGWILRFLGMSGVAKEWVRVNNLIHLNILESASLAASIFMFYSAIILHDSNTSFHGRMIMSGCTFLMNVMFVCYALYRLYAGLHVLMDAKLEVVNVSFLATHSNNIGVMSLLKKAIASIRSEDGNRLKNRVPVVNPDPTSSEMTMEIPERLDEISGL